MLTKSEFRRHLRNQRRNLSPEFRRQASAAMVARLTRLLEWQTARTMGCYLSFSDEVDTLAIFQAALAQDKRLAVPFISGLSQPMRFAWFSIDQALAVGPMGINQPEHPHWAQPSELELLILPGLGFDQRGFRLGYGQGFFDRYLSGYRGITLGLGFETQRVETLPTDPWDHPVQLLITEERTVRFFQP